MRGTGLERIFIRSDARRLALLGIVTGSMVAASAAAQEAGGPTPQQLARDRENPFAQTINLPLAAVTGFGIGPHHDVGEQLTIQPQLPLPLDADWNLIVRSLLPVTFSPDPQRRFGLGDVQPSFFLTPARSTGLIWGAGPAFQFPTATSNELGTGKWSAGPTGALVYSDSEIPWFAGILVTQLWSFAGAPRTAVNQTSTEVDLSLTPSNVSPVVTKRQSAMSSLRASATIIVLRVPARLSAVRPGSTGPVRSPSETTESARRVGSCHGGPGRCRFWQVLVNRS